MKIQCGFHLPRAKAVKSLVLVDRQTHAHPHTVRRRSLWWLSISLSLLLPPPPTHSWSAGLPLEIGKNKPAENQRKMEHFRLCNTVYIYVKYFCPIPPPFGITFLCCFYLFCRWFSISTYYYPLSPSPQLSEINPGSSWIQHYAQKQNSS